MIPYSNVYEESYRCNFLGLSPDASLSQHVMTSEMFVRLDILPHQESGELAAPPYDSWNTLNSIQSDVDLDACQQFKHLQFKLSSPVNLPLQGTCATDFISFYIVHSVCLSVYMFVTEF